jgi:hypothetical protein
MPKVLRDADGLSPAEARFALYLSQGMTQADAFRKAWPKTRAAMANVHQRASVLANRIEIKQRVRELLRQAKASDLLSAAEWMQWTMRLAEQAESSKQLAAAGSLMRLIGQANGAISDRGLGQSELGFSEENLLERLSGGDPDKKRLLASLLGKPSFASSVQTATDSHTKH